MGSDLDIEESYYEAVWASPDDQRLRYTLGYSRYNYDYLSVSHFIHPTAGLNGMGSTPSVGTQSVNNGGFFAGGFYDINDRITCLLYTSPSPRDRTRTRMPSSA